MDLSNKTAIVTGGAHRVGKGIGMALAEKGTNIVVHYGRSKDAAFETVNEFKDLGVEAAAYSADLSDTTAIDQLFREISPNFELDILVNSAASFVKEPILSTSIDDWEKSLNINLRAPLLMMQHAVPLIRDQGEGLIVNISDLSGVFAWKNFASHGVSKAGLIHLGKIAAREFAPEIRVNTILPGPILPPPDVPTTDPKWKEMIDNIPLKRSGDPENIGQTVVYFAENDFITGAVLNVDGGEMLVGPANH